MNTLTWLCSIVDLLLILCQLTDAILPSSSGDLQFLPSKMDGFKVDLHRVLEGSRVRKKRQIPYGTSEHQMRVGSAASVDLPYLSDFKLKFWTPVEHHSARQVLVGTEEGHLILFAISPDSDTVGHIIAVSYENEVSEKAQAFSYLDEQWFVVLHIAEIQTLLRLYVKVGRGLEQRQVILLDGKSDIHLVTMKGIHYLAVVTYQEYKNQGSLSLYHWKQTQFDLIASRTVFGPRSVTCWVLDGTLYIALAQRIDGDEYSFGSPIYQYNARNERGLVLHQMLTIYGPKKVIHFYVSSNHYVIFIGMQEAAIYWWSNNQFLLWQVIQNTANAVDAAILSLENGEVLIVIALKEEVLFATLDSSGHYVVTFTMSFSGYNLLSAQFMYSGQAYYALTLFQQKVQGTYKLTLDPYFNPRESGLDSLRSCLRDVSDSLDERQNEMNNIHIDLSRVWLRNGNQNIESEVFIAGETSSNKKSILTEILVILDKKILPDSSLAEVNNQISGLKTIAENVEYKTGDSVRKSVHQNISGTLHFDQPVFIPSLNLKSTSLDVPINGISVSRIDETALKLTGDQAFTSPLHIKNLYSSTINTEYINGIQTNDYLLLHGEQLISGHLDFFNVQAADLKTNTINSIPVDHLVTQSSDQALRDLKIISQVNSDVINVEGQTNGEILRELETTIIQKETDDEIKSSFTLLSPSYILGDIFLTGMINGHMDLAHLLENSVTTNSVQEIKGHAVFESPITVRDDVGVEGNVNDLNTNQLMTLSSDQVVSGNLEMDHLTIQNDVTVGLINDVNLVENAVLKTPESQFVTGTNIFLQDIIADSIEMTEYVTLDGVDLSLLVQDIVKHREGKVKEDHTYFHKIVVLGNLTALDGINNHNVFDLPDITWLKNTQQIIDVPITVKQVSTLHDIFVNRINTIHLDTDVIRSFGDETIESTKFFEDSVAVSERVDVKDEAKINGMDLVSIKFELENYVDEGTVRGVKVLNYLEINGDLEAATFNKLHALTDFIRPYEYQLIKAPVTFASDLTVLEDGLQANSVKFDRFNSIELDPYFHSTVTKSPTQVLRNKGLPTIQGTKMILSEESKLNEIPFTWLLERVVTLDKPQHILSDKIFDHIKLESMSVQVLNGIDISTLVNEVVLTDDVKTISSKKFHGLLQTPNLVVGQPLNGISTDHLAQNVFYKTKDTEMFQPVTFLNDLHVGKLYTLVRLDGKDWNDLIFINNDGALDTAWLMSDAQALTNVFVKGNVNGCDLIQLEMNALYSNKPIQHIKEDVLIETIEVIGNVHIEDAINELPVHNLLSKLVLLHGDQAVSSDVIINSGIQASNINVALADLDISFILSDAVRNSVPQGIYGYKKFSSLQTNGIDTKDLLVSGELNGVNVDQFLNNVVWKQDHQTIEGDKIFGSLTANVISIEGYLNGLKLPEDIVKVETDDVITSSIVFLSDLIIVGDLSVDGELAGTNLANLIHNRVTLDTDEDLLSKLSLLYDITINGDLKIDGMLNEIALELIAKTSQNVPLEGYKVFIKDLYVNGMMNSSYINGYNVPTLDQSTLKRNEEEFIKDLQVFEKPFKAGNHLFTDWINSISLTDISSSFFTMMSNFNKTLNYLEELTFGFLKILTRQIDTLETKISKFAYFILLQEVKLEPTLRFLHGYRLEHESSDFSHSMIIWTNQKHCLYLGTCCHEEFSHWIRVKKSGYLMVDSPPEAGRLYSIHNPDTMTTDKDFFLWTNATGFKPKWCNTDKPERMILTSTSDLKDLDVFIDSTDPPTLSDIKSFRRRHLYAVAGFYYDRKEGVYSSAVIYKFNEIQREWTEHQLLPSYGVLSLDVTSQASGQLLLAVGTAIGGYSSVYKWDDSENKFYLLQNIPSNFVTSTLWVKQRSSQYLVMANVEEWPRKEAFCSDLVSGGGVNIYSFDGHIKLIQSIPITGVVSVVSFNIEGDTFLAAASIKLQNVYIYEWKGYSGFSEVQTIYVGEVTHLNTYSIGDDIYMTVATLSGPAKVLKLVVQGRHAVQSLQPKLPYPDAQKDEALKEQKTGC